MRARGLVASRLFLTELLRRPLIIVLIVTLPFFFITRAIANTDLDPRTIGLPGGIDFDTNMRDVHGASMAEITIAFISGLGGAFVARSSRQSDQRLVVAGYTPLQVLVPRFSTMIAIAGLATASSLAVTALGFEPQSWLLFVAGNMLIALTYAAIGGLAGTLFGQLGSTYLVLFMAMLGMGILQNPMFGDGTPGGLAYAMPDYAASRVVIDAAFAPGFSSIGLGLLAAGWIAVLFSLLVFTLSRTLRTRGRGINMTGNATPAIEVPN